LGSILFLILKSTGVDSTGLQAIIQKATDDWMRELHVTPDELTH